MTRRKTSEQAPRAALDIPQAPVGLLQGFLAPWRMLRLLLARPFAWVRPGLASFLVFVAIISLVSEVVANALFPGGQALDLMRGRQFASSFLPWLFSPAIYTIFLAGSLLFLGRGRLGYGLALEPLRCRTSSLLGLGLLSMLVAMLVVGAGRAWLVWGSVAAGIFMMLGWTPLMTLATTNIWADESTLWNSLRWATGTLWRHKLAWVGIGACYLLMACATVGLVTAAGLLMMGLGADAGVMALAGVILIATIGWAATLFYGLGALLALSFHHTDLGPGKAA